MASDDTADRQFPNNPTGSAPSVLAKSQATAPFWVGASNLVNMHNDAASQTVLNAGGGQPHNNMQPYLTINFCIALQGLFPSRN
jgi:microcystin-dependent protein